MGVFDFLGDIFGSGESPERPPVPQYQLPEWARGLPPEILQVIRRGIGAQVPTPAEYGISSQVLQSLLQPQIGRLAEPAEYGLVSRGLQELAGLQPEQFQLPIEDILGAQQAQQAIQQQNWLQQIRPQLAAAGQLDSTYEANLLADYLQQQQAQQLGLGAQLRTQQALENLATQRWLPGFQAGALGQLGALGAQRAAIPQYNIELQKWLPAFQAGIAGQLAGLGGQRAALGLQNIQLPFQTTIPALQGMYTTGLTEADRRFQQAMAGYQQEMDVYNQAQQQRQGLASLGLGLGVGALTGGMGLLPGIASGWMGAGKGALMGMGGLGSLGTMATLGTLFPPTGGQQPTTTMASLFARGSFGTLGYPYGRGIGMGGGGIGMGFVDPLIYGRTQRIPGALY